MPSNHTAEISFQFKKPGQVTYRLVWSVWTFAQSYILLIKIYFFYHLEYSDYCFRLPCYIHYILSNMLSGLLQVFLVELGSLHRFSNWTIYFIRVGSVDCYNFGTYKPNVSMNQWNTIYYYVWFFTLAHITFFLIEPFWLTCQPKRCEYKNEDENNSLNILSDKNYQTSSPKLRQNLLFKLYWEWFHIFYNWKESRYLYR